MRKFLAMLYFRNVLGGRARVGPQVGLDDSTTLFIHKMSWIKANLYSGLLSL